MAQRRGPKPATAMAAVEAFCSAVTAKRYVSQLTVSGYRNALRPVIRTLANGGRHTLPWLIDEEDVIWLAHELDRQGLTVQSRHGYLSALRQLTMFYGNTAVANAKIRLPHDMRPNVRWLSFDQAAALLRLPVSPMDALIIHCELCLGMRRVEVLRLTVSSFAGNYVDIVGKGPGSGKPRRMPYHHDTAAVLSRYMDFRRSLIETANARHPHLQVPDALLIWIDPHDIVHSYCKHGTAIDSHLEQLAPLIGYTQHLANHTLRRTFGRIMYRSGVEPATISKMLGHTSVEQTLEYIGVDMDDMSAAMQIFKL